MMTTLSIPLLILGIICLIFGLLLSFADKKLKVKEDPLVDQINEQLPQTQCAQCGYPGCLPYANAVSQGEDINKCTPGGEQAMLKLAELTGREPMPLGDNESLDEAVKLTAFIHEADCIGCTKCIQACPVDAIVGATRQMHTVISSECTGCELCVAPCPTDCIEMKAIPQSRNTWQWQLDSIAVNNIDEEHMQ